MISPLSGGVADQVSARSPRSTQADPPPEENCREACDERLERCLEEVLGQGQEAARERQACREEWRECKSAGRNDADLDGVCEAVEAAGGGILRRSEIAMPGPTRAVMIHDPDGQRIELIDSPGDPNALPMGGRRR